MKDKIYIYGDDIGCVELIDYMGSDLTIVNSARVSFGKHKEEIDEKDEKLIKYLVKNKHTSTFEHNVATFRFVVPIFVRSQHHRHRTWSYNEISRRYTDYDIKFYESTGFRTQHKSNRQASNLNDMGDPILNRSSTSGGSHASYMVKKHHLESINLYEKLLKAGVCREQARGVLPQNMYTEYYGTCNLNNLLKFIDLRIHEGAQWEIQKVAQSLLEIATDLWPVAVSSYKEVKEK